MGHRLNAGGFFALCIPVRERGGQEGCKGGDRRWIARWGWWFGAFDLGGPSCQVITVFYGFGGRIGTGLRDGFDLAIGGVGVLDLRVEGFGLERRTDKG